MKNFVEKLIYRLTIPISGNFFVQRFLQINVKLFQYLMGIGAGASVENSGEKGIIFKLRQWQRPGECCNIFDIGANKGQFANYLLANLTGIERYHIYCFEPSSFAFNILFGKHQNNDKITLNNIGISNYNGKGILYYDKPGTGLSSLSQRLLPHFDIYFDKSESVNIDTVDNYCSKNSIEFIDLMKIDVEGHELNVLMGAKNMFDNDAIRMVSFEFGGCNIESRTFFQEFYYFFKQYEMSLYRITPSGYLFPITDYKEDYEQFRTTNYLAIRDNVN